jgi:hypothetical protein
MKHKIYNFCTLFDSYYLPKGLVLYDSLCAVCDNFHLYVFAFDDQCYKTLENLKLLQMTVISLKEFETEELLKVKPTRTRAEYCWTCGASTIWYAIQHFNLDHCTYIDADIMFFSSPKVAFDEFEKENASIVMTEHFTKTEDPAGRFCVQFVYFKNDEDGIKALSWWMERCIEWCFARYEEDKFGDQKYLEFFPLKFNNVYVMKNRGVGIAPWNMKQYHYINNDTFIFEGKDYPIVFFHYHGIITDVKFRSLILKTVTFDITTDTEKYFFKPFCTRYKKICETYLNINIDSFIMKRRKITSRIYTLLKHYLKANKLIQFFYYSINKKRHEGHEKNILITIKK